MRSNVHAFERMATRAHARPGARAGARPPARACGDGTGTPSKIPHTIFRTSLRYQIIVVGGVFKTRYAKATSLMSIGIIQRIERLLRVLPPAMLFLFLLNIVFMGVVLFVFSHNTEARNILLQAIIDKCLGR